MRLSRMGTQPRGSGVFVGVPVIRASQRFTSDARATEAISSVFSCYCNNRSGADLSNVGERFPDAAKLYSYLYDPYILNGHSSMPEYRFLFVTQKISGQPAKDALVLAANDAPPAGFEVVPTSQARALVAYLLSLKKGYHLKPDEAGIPYVPPAPTKS